MLKELSQPTQAVFKQIVESAPNAMILVNKAGKMVFANKQTEELFGYSAEELIGNDVELLVPDSVVKKHVGLRDMFKAAPAKRLMGVERNFSAKRKNGFEFSMEIGLNPIEIEGELMVLASILDITKRIKTEKKLEDLNAKLKQAQALAHIGSWELDFATNVVSLSDELCSIYGIPASENQQSLEVFYSFVHPDDLAFVTQEISASTASLQDASFYHRIVRKDGVTRYIHSESRAEMNGEGMHCGFYGTTQDITEQKGMEEGLRTSEANLRTVFENTDVGFLFLSPTYAVLAFNKISIEWAANVFGISIKDHTNFKELLLPESRAAFERFAGGILAGKAITYETSYPKPDGTLMWFTVGGKPVMDDGKVTGICIAITDITERRASEDKITRISNLNAFIGQVNQNIVHIKDKNNLFKNACRIACEFGKFKIAWIGLFDIEKHTINLVDQTGLPEEQIEQFANIPCRPGGPQEQLLKNGGYYVSNDSENEVALQYWKVIGSALAVRSCMLLAIKKSNRVIGTLNLYSTETGFFDKEKMALLQEVANDISFALDMFEKADRQKEAEELVIKNEKRFRALIEKSSDMITLATAEGEMIYGSPSVSDILGYTQEEYVNKPGFDFIHPDDIAVFLEKRKQILKTPGASFYVQQRLRHKNGNWLWCEDTDTNMLHDPDVKAIVSNFTDITARKEAENKIAGLNEKLHGSNLQLHAILNTLPAHIALLDETGKIIALNESWIQFGIDNRLRSTNSCLGDNYIQVCEVATGADTQDGQKMATGTRQILEGNLKEFALEYPCHSPNEKRWFRVEVRPLTDSKNTGAVVMHINITEQKLAADAIKDLNENLEVRVHERTAELTEANNALEAFSYSVSHDLRAPVRSIVGFTKIILQDYGAKMEPDLKELFNFIEDSTHRMNNLINDLLKLARYGKSRINIQTVNMHQLTTSVWANIARTTANHASLELSPLPEVYADRSLIEQVLVNLISNAVKYSSKKEKPVLKIWCVQTKQNFTFYFKDNGAGFDMKSYSRLFGPFQRLHSMSEFEGTGVGLMLVKRIVEQHGGVVGAQGVVGEGATFYFTLPVVVEKNEEGHL